MVFFFFGFFFFFFFFFFKPFLGVQTTLRTYPDTFRLSYDQGETSNQHDNKKLNKVKGIEYKIYLRRVS